MLNKVMSNKPNVLVLLDSHISRELSELRDKILGKVLTVIDGSISDPTQRKGLKDVIRQVISFDEAKWNKYRIKRMLEEFNDKFLQVELSDEEAKYFAGRHAYIRSEGEKVSSEDRLVDTKKYFPGN